MRVLLKKMVYVLFKPIMCNLTSACIYVAFQLGIRDYHDHCEPIYLDEP